MLNRKGQVVWCSRGHPGTGVWEEVNGAEPGSCRAVVNSSYQKKPLPEGDHCPLRGCLQDHEATQMPPRSKEQGARAFLLQASSLCWQCSWQSLAGSRLAKQRQGSLSFRIACKGSLGAERPSFSNWHSHTGGNSLMYTFLAFSVTPTPCLYLFTLAS